jgi:hypothetical protein
MYAQDLATPTAASPIAFRFSGERHELGASSTTF